jgi:1,4-alpha-glucan branching enzyme
MTNEPFHMTTEAAAAILEGRADDPFAVLGLHKYGKSQVVTAFAPGAERLWVVIGRSEIEARALPGYDGIFEAVLPKKSTYRLRAQGHGSEWAWEDPFRFGPVMGEMDEYLLGEGTHKRIWQVLGAHLVEHEGLRGTHFAVWAPNAARVSVVGDFNIWDGRRHPMRRRGATGVWETFIPAASEGFNYKYEIRSKDGVVLPLKADPVGFGSEHPPANVSVVRNIGKQKWHDADWMARRGALQNIDAPISIYEVHLGSWAREEGNRMLSYGELASRLVTYVADMGFTHIELLPITEFPFDGSWGYQPVGLFAPTIRHGRPEEFSALIDAAHDAGLGVFLDWVPGHFPSDAHGLSQFDGTHLYEHANPKEGFHQDWNTLIYNYGRVEVSNYLTSNALYWLEEYHLDGLRVDAVASMLYRDYSRKSGEWVPNKDGGRENLEAIAQMQRVNTVVYGECPGIVTMAEESTDFPGVSRPVEAGGLGFGYKWNMGWMNDTLSYMQKDPIHRKFHHHQMTFGLSYAYSENFILPLSHDEVVHGKGSMLTKMPGSEAEKFANLRAYYGFMWGHPGKKLMFMGLEFAQSGEWNHSQSLDWHLLEQPLHRGVKVLVRDLNLIYRDTAALHVNDVRPEGFEWLEANDTDASVYVWLRKGKAGDAQVVCVVNLTPAERQYRIGLPGAGQWDEILNTDAEAYGGGNRGNFGGVQSEAVAHHGQAQSALIRCPPLSTIWFRQTQ